MVVFLVMSLEEVNSEWSRKIPGNRELASRPEDQRDEAFSSRQKSRTVS
jgi:hypothetical protein